MRAVTCQDAVLDVVEVPDLRPEKGQLLLRVLRCGICGSDLHARHHAAELAEATVASGYDGIMRPGEQIVFGHEFVGEVVDGARGFPSGAHVVALPMRRAGGEIHMTGLSRHAPGAYAEQVIVEKALAMTVPNGLPPEHAALTEPMAVALHAVRRSEISRRDTALVVGCGPIGLAVIAMLKARGVGRVVGADYAAGRRAKALAVGADVVVDPGAESPYASFEDSAYFTRADQLVEFAMTSMRRLRRQPLPWWHVMRAAEAAGAMPRGPVVFECVGVPGVLDQIIAAAPHRTRVVVVGVTMEPDVIRPAIAINKEIDLRFVIVYTPREFRDALMMLADGEVPVGEFVTGVVGLDGVAAAFDVLGDPRDHVKILIDPASTATAPGGGS